MYLIVTVSITTGGPVSALGVADSAYILTVRILLREHEKKGCERGHTPYSSR